MASPWRAPFSDSKYGVVLTLLMMQDSWLVNNIKPVNKIITLAPFSKTTSKNPNVFLISTVTKWPSMFNLSEIPMITDIDLPLSPMYLF